MARKVTAQKLHDLGVKHGPDLPLSQDSKVALVKAQICNAMKKLYGDDMRTWKRVLQHARGSSFFQSEPQKTAVEQVLKELEEA